VRLLRSQYAVTLDTGLLLGPGTGVTEVVIAPRSPLIGERLCAGMTTPDGDLVVLAARRGDELLRGQEFIVQAGDALLLQGGWDDLSRHSDEPACSPSIIRRACDGRFRWVRGPNGRW
jgi:hypothetical protein